jgi:hypothetical protein
MGQISNLLQSTMGLGLLITLGLGDLYWLFLAIKLGSFIMFIIGSIPVLAVFTGPIGMWSLFFGPPSWIFDLFG